MRNRPSRTIFDTALNHTLPTGVSGWGLVLGLLVMFGHKPSRTIQSLPPWEAFGWAVLMTVSSITILGGLFFFRNLLMASRGMLLLAIAITIYWISIIYVVGWNDGGAIATFLLVISTVVAREGVIMRQRAIPRTGGDGGRAD